MAPLMLTRGYMMMTRGRYVSYCANFMAGTALLANAVKADRELAKLVEMTEAQLTRRNIVERGVNSPVSIYAFLIKPVQVISLD